MTIFWKESSIRFRGVSLYVCLHIYFHSKSTAELQYFSNKELLVRFFWNRLSHYLLLLNDHVLDIACATFSVIYHEDYSNDYAIYSHISTNHSTCLNIFCSSYSTSLSSNICLYSFTMSCCL